MRMPEIECYYQPSGENVIQVILLSVTVWFSYKTLVAFFIDGKYVVHTNDWGITTGKHLNAIDGGNKAGRVSDAEFQRLWKELT